MYFDKGLGKPAERVEHRTPQTLAELEELSTEGAGADSG
jgi:hypothetical protein